MEAVQTMIFMVFWTKCCTFNIHLDDVLGYSSVDGLTDKNKNHRTHEELGYKSINTSRFWFAEEPVILATQAHQVFYLEDPKNGINWKIVQAMQNKRVWDVPEVEDIKNDQLNVIKIIIKQRVDEHVIEDDTLCRTEVDPTIVERPNVCHVLENFINDEDDKQSSHQASRAMMNNNIFLTYTHLIIFLYINYVVILTFICLMLC